MELKVIQLNARERRRYNEISSFLGKTDADIVLVQEDREGVFCRGEGQKKKYGYGEDLAKMYGYEYVHGPSFGADVGDRVDQAFVSVFSRYPIVDWKLHYHPILGPYRVEHKDFFGFHLQQNIPKEKAELRMRFQTLPSCILECLVRLGNIYLRLITTHFTASAKCTETYLMRKHAEKITDIYNVSKRLPTIVSGDFNTLPESASVRHLKHTFDYVDVGGVTTLNPRIHPGFHNDIGPDGYQVDHILYKDLVLLESSVLSEVDVSDHFPVFARFSL